MLTADPEQRIDILEIEQHAWLAATDAELEDIDVPEEVELDAVTREIERLKRELGHR